jgi:hypothetical protein
MEAKFSAAAAALVEEVLSETLLEPPASRVQECTRRSNLTATALIIDRSSVDLNGSLVDAAELGYPSVVSLLLERGATRLHEALEAAARGGHAEIVGLLVEEMKKGDRPMADLWHSVLQRRRTLGSNHPDTLASISTLGCALREEGRVGEAEALHREALEAHRARGTSGEALAAALCDLAATLLAPASAPQNSTPPPPYRRPLRPQSSTWKPCACGGGPWARRLGRRCARSWPLPAP